MTELINPADSAVGPVPLVLGVTGHRDLRDEDLPAIKTEVRNVFAGLKAKLRHTPLKLLSPLAAGADRLVADLALDCGVGLIVPLPWPEGVHDSLIHRTGDRQQFDDLLSRAEQTVHLPLADGLLPEDVRQSDSARDRQYGLTGAYIARHSQILIALWDGEDLPDSGTAQVVKWQQTGVAAPFAVSIGRLDELENGPVCHVITPRTSRPSEGQTVRTVTRNPATFQNEAEADRTCDELWRHIDTFNSDVTSGSSALAAQAELSREWILSEDEWASQSPPLKAMFDCFVLADAVSIVFRDTTLRTLKGLFLTMLTALLCYEVYTHLFVDVWPLLLGYLILLGGVFLWQQWSLRKELQSRYLDSRALAEALRVQCFWRMAGLNDSVVDHYLRNLRSELDWIRQALLAVNLVHGGHQSPAPADSESLTVVQSRWVKAQLKFFENGAARDEEKEGWWHRRSRWLFAAAAGLASVQLVVHLATHHLNHVLAVLVFVAIACSALCHEFAELQAYSIQAKRYDWMRSFFRTGNQQLEGLIKSSEYGEAQEVIRELGREALQENAEWLLQRRRRPIRPPQV